MSYWLSLHVAQDSYSLANTTSTITIKTYMNWDSSSWSTDEDTLTIKVGDTTVDTLNTGFNPEQTASGSQLLRSTNYNVSHGSNVPINITVSATYASTPAKLVSLTKRLAVFYKVQDLHYEDKSKGQTYRSYFDTSRAGGIGITDAHSYVTAQSLDDEALNCDKLNSIGAETNVMQDKWETDVLDVLDAKTTAFNALVSNLHYDQEWDSTVAYTRNQTVRYNNDGKIYLCIKNAEAGTSLSNTTYWASFNIQGDKGDSGFGLTWKGEWNGALNQYNEKDIVYIIGHNNVIFYVCRTNGLQSTDSPADDTTNWYAALTVNRAYFHTVSSVPSQTYPNEWFYMLDETDGVDMRYIDSGNIVHLEPQTYLKNTSVDNNTIAEAITNIVNMYNL